MGGGFAVKPLRILVGCEFSGIVRDAFRALGHDAWSCDLLPCESDPAFHYQCNVQTVLELHWDLGIFHPSCTYLCNSGVRWLYGGKGKVIDKDRWQQMVEAATFFKALLNAPIDRIAIENPIPHRYALQHIETPYTQIVQPFWFNEPTQKATCLWLKNLPKLVPTGMSSERKQKCHLESPGPDRWKERSRTVKGLALAMANQWGNL